MTAHDPLRPKSLAEFTGQPRIVAQLDIVLGGAKARGELPPHLLFSGPPGLGKTTLANIVATEMGLPLVLTSGPAVAKPGDLAGLLTSLERPSVVFVDEIHRLKAEVQEMLYTAMEDGRIDILIGEGPGRSRAIPMALEDFVLVGATTRSGLLTKPLRDRFGYIGQFTLYDTPTLAAIVARSAQLLGRSIDADAAHLLAARSRGTPRIANMLLHRVRDVADRHGGAGTGAGIDTVLVEDALAQFGVDPRGLDKVDLAILATLAASPGGRPVGLKTLAAHVNEEPSTLEEVHEPYLLRAGLLERTPQGRVATAATYAHLGLDVPASLGAPEATLPLGGDPEPAPA